MCHPCKTAFTALLVALKRTNEKRQDSWESSDFSRYCSGFMGFKELCAIVLQDSVQDAKYPGVFPSYKHETLFLIAYEHFDFPTEGENICRGRTAINQPLTGRNRRGRERERCVDW
jgi:hypothetical protein